MTHSRVADLLGAFALDAVDDDEAAEVERHLELCPRCRAELAEYRELTAAFASPSQDVPAGIWDRITTGMGEIPPPLRLDRVRPDAGELVVHPLPLPQTDAPVRSLVGRATRSRRVVPAIAAAAAAIVAVAGTLAVVHTTTNSATMREVRAALASPGSRKVVLRSAKGQTALDAVIEPATGTGYLYDSDLTPLPKDQVYQLWGMVGTTRISYGLLGTAPVEQFTAGAGVDGLAVTDEVSTGVVKTVHPFIAFGVVSPHL